jgi:hypothetical protein
MTAAANSSPNGANTSIKEIAWEFVVDRFGVRPNDKNTLKIDFAREAVRSLSFWFQTIEFLYGDSAEAIALATNAGFLPQYPLSRAAAKMIELLQTSLMLQRSGRAGDDFSAVALPDRYAAPESIGEDIMDPRTQDLVEQLRLYLEEMQTWGPVFRAATWVASLAGTGSTMSTAQGRLLQGLRSVIAVCEFHATLNPTAVLDRFRGILSGSGGEDDSPLQSQLRSALKQGENLLHYSGSNSWSKPTEFYQWLQEFREAAQDYPHQSSTVPATSWDALEDAYWGQWRWPSMGAVSRVSSGATGAGGAGDVSALDLIYTTRYGSVPLLHWRGGNLSICQWSRILTIASLRGTRALQAPSAAGVGNLGFSEPSPPPGSHVGTIAGRPIVMISPISDDSAIWTWRPEPGTRAFALVPRKLADDDEEAARPSSDKVAPAQPASDGWSEIAGCVARIDRHSTALLHFVETADGNRPEEGPVNDRIPWAPWKQIDFGSSRDGLSQRFIAERPRSLGELVDLTKRHYPEVFPTPVDENDTAFARALHRLGRWMRSTQYEMARDFAAAARFLGLGKRKRRLASFFRRVKDSYLRH